MHRFQQLLINISIEIWFLVLNSLDLGLSYRQMSWRTKTPQSGFSFA